MIGKQTLVPELQDTLSEDHFDKMPDRIANKYIDRYYTGLAEEQTVEWLQGIATAISKATSFEEIKDPLLNLVSYIHEKVQRIPEEV